MVNMYADDAKHNILKELSINIAKLHDIYGLVLKDEFLINAAYLQRVTDSIDQLGTINKKMQRIYSMLADEEKYEKYRKEEVLSDRWVPKVKVVNGNKTLQSEMGYVKTRSVTAEEAAKEKWGYNPYEE